MNGSDICECGDFRGGHKPICFCGCPKFRFFSVASEVDVETWNRRSKVIQMPPTTYTAKLFEVPWESALFKIAGTLDGFIDLATPKGTYPLSLSEAKALIAALESSISDVENNCLYERDGLARERDK